ncbi:MAG: hypothetical protein GXO91_06175, partial [FCB group bacterium]|nr:hypothetical protein [FCB group bacterium]
DCAGVCFGTAFIDDCEVCSEGDTGHAANSDMDCAGVCFGESVTDDCGDCVLPADFNAAMDCNGDCDGVAYIDDCGVCSDGNSGHEANADDLGCGCFEPAPLEYCFDYDGDGLGNPGSETLFCANEIPDGYVLDCTDESPDGEVTIFIGDPLIDETGVGTVDILYNNSNLPINGYQFVFTGVTLLDAVTDNPDFSISFNADNGQVLAFSMSGGFYPAGDGTLATLTFQHTGPAVTVCIEDLLVAGSSGHAPVVYNDYCLDIPEGPMDCNGDYYGIAELDDCGVCSGGDSGHEWNSDQGLCR